MPPRAPLYLCLSVCICGSALAEDLRLPITADTTLVSVEGQQASANGGSTRLKTKGHQEVALLDFDAASLRGRTIRAATLHVRSAAMDAPQLRVSLSTIASPWVEGRSTSYNRDEASATFLWSGPGRRPWSFPGSDFTSVAFAQGHTTWAFADATPPDGAGWQAVPVRPDLVAACVAGLSHGLAMQDDVGSEYARDGNAFAYRTLPNRTMSSREDRGFPPYVVVTPGEEDRRPPKPPGPIASDAKGLPPGEAMVRWQAPADDGPAGVTGFHVRWAEGPAIDWDEAAEVPRYLIPRAPPQQGGLVTMHLRDLPAQPGATIALAVRAVDAAGNVGPAATGQVTLSNAPATVELPVAPATPFAGRADRPEAGGVRVAVIDALDKVHPVTGATIPARDAAYLEANHLFSAREKLVRLFAARGETVDFQVLLSGASDAAEVKLEMDEAALRPALHRFRHVRTREAGMLPDPLVPLDGPVAIPARDERIEGQAHATLLAEVHVSQGAKAGKGAGVLTVRSGGGTARLRVELTVWDFELPDRLSFLPEMNCYGLPAGQEVAYYRLAHAHRTVLNRLAYNWRGQVHERWAPRWDGARFDFAAWDALAGPLLDGSAFADLPRGAVPVEKFYLPINENWPVPIDEHFKGGYWIDDALAPAYRARLVQAMRRYAEHLAAKAWDRTTFELYLNNKVYYKKDDWRRCSAPWVFDEPASTQDFWALRWYGQAWREATAPFAAKARLAYRCDVSRPQWQRDTLDGLLDVNVVSGAFRAYRRAVLDRKRLHHPHGITQVYGTANAIEAPNAHAVAWALDAWTLGAEGILPWQTVGTDKSWQEADALSLFYPGKAGPVPSARLKACRRAQQDVEYLALLDQRLATPAAPRRLALASAVRAALELEGDPVKQADDDAGTIRYGRAEPRALWHLRLRVAARLQQLSEK